MKTEKKLTVKEALSLIAFYKEGKRTMAHAMEGLGGAMMGFGIEKSSIIEKLNEAKEIVVRELAGHSICVIKKNGMTLFIEHDREKLAAFLDKGTIKIELRIFADVDSKTLPKSLDMKLDECPVAYMDKEMDSNHMFSLPQVEQYMKDNEFKITKKERTFLDQLAKQLDEANVAYFRIYYR